MMFLGFCLLAGVAVASSAQAAEEGSPVAHPAAAVETHPEREPGSKHAEPGGEESGGEAHAGEAHEIDAKKLALQLLNFGVLLFILIKFGGSAVNKALLARHQQMKADLAAAAEARAAAEQRLKKQDLRMANLEKEIAAMRAGIAQEAEAEKARLIAAAEERARRIHEETTFIIEQQVKQGEAALRREASQSAMKIAEDILRRSMDGRDQQRLLDGFIEDVSSHDAPRKVS